MITNVPPDGPEKDLPRVAWRIGRAIQQPNAFEVVIGWNKNSNPDLGERTYRRIAGVVVTFPVIRGRFSVRAAK